MKSVKAVVGMQHPVDNISRNGHNAQKGGRCSSFLLSAMDGALQIVARLRNLVAVGYRLPWGRRNWAVKCNGDRHEEAGFGRGSARDNCGFGFRGGYACEGV